MISRTAPALAVDEIGSFHVGGRIIRLDDLPMRDRVSTPDGPSYRVDPNGEIVVGQLYVQYVRLSAPKAAAPLLLWHGAGMTGAAWESTPDRRPGWLMFFLRAGFDTYVSDAVERGRASFAPFPQVYPEAPFFRTAKESWEDAFRCGPPGSWNPDPALRRSYPDSLFPVEAFEAFMSQCVPRWSCNDALTQAAYDALLQHFDRDVVILTHSQGGNFGLTAAIHAPERVRAIVSLEPSGAPDPASADPALLNKTPHLFVWGDNWRDSAFWAGSRPASERWRDALAAAGCDVTWVDLPARGVRGNSHALMADRNSDDIAGLVLDWMAARGLVHS
ncbi:MAG: alpha/beta fold hydrolase [Methylocystis sp.]|uniref:alpha/beta fold hydrolase n=1 Tax=Methylocystis sp. TaxID=1911079 RepID=UPI003D0DBC51